MFKNKVLKRTCETFLTLLLASFLLFTMIHLAPGDPVKMLLGNSDIALEDNGDFQQRYEEKRQALGLEDPIIRQYARWLYHAIRLEFGDSIYTGRPVVIELLDRMPATLLLTLPAIVIQLFLGVSLGILSSLKANGKLDNVIRMLCVTFSSVPGFALCLMLIYIFAVKLKIYEISHTVSLTRLYLPMVTLGVISSPALVRVVRNSMLEELSAPYTSFALARGIGKWNILVGCFRNIVLPIVTIFGSSFANLIGGSVIIESVFSWPGIGQYAMESILLRDYPVVQGYGFFMICIVIGINFLVDSIYILVEPRLKHKERDNVHVELT
jgi:peptide/nickel transport system permease protein